MRRLLVFLVGVALVGCSINRTPVAIGNGKYRMYTNGLLFKGDLAREGAAFCKSRSQEFHDFGFSGDGIAGEYTFGCGTFTYSPSRESSSTIVCDRLDAMTSVCEKF